MSDQGKPLLLLAEDDPDDVLLFQQALSRVSKNVMIHNCPDGAEAMEYLKGTGIYADRAKFPMPRAIVTDLKMPRCDGLELLEWIKNHPEMQIIPTIVFTSSIHDSDVKRAFKAGANAYFQKPTSFDELIQVVRVNFEYWSACRLPQT
jgi:CheY-like chemotaxis protein